MKHFTTFLLSLLFVFKNVEVQYPVNAGFNHSVNGGYQVKFFSQKSAQDHYWTFGSKNGQGKSL